MTDQPLELFFVRHGESLWNLEGRIQGQSTAAPGLTPTGRSQASAVAAELAGSGAEMVISSDLRRAVETATPIADGLGLGLRLDPRLRERALGAAEGRAVEVVEREHELGVEDGAVADVDSRPAGGESIRELYGRVTLLVESLRESQAGKIVLVTHGGVVRVAKAVLSGQPPEQMAWGDVDNASVWWVSVP